MRRYRLPGFETRLLRELQRQQNSTLFCDTLLQTEGVSVPAHGCILAALSPNLSQKLSACPFPLDGQQRQLQLRAVKAQTLLKLVGLLYSGELEVKGTEDLEEVLTAARQLGIGQLEEGRTLRREGEVEEEQCSCRRCREARMLAEGWIEGEGSRRRDVEMQVGMEGRRDTETQVEERRCVSTGTQTVNADEQAMDRSTSLPRPIQPPNPELGPNLAQSRDNLSSSSTSQNITLPNLLNPGPSPPLLSITGTPNDVHLEHLLEIRDVKADDVAGSTSSPVLTSPGASSDYSSCPRPQEGRTHPLSPVLDNNMKVLASERRAAAARKKSRKIQGKRDQRQQPTYTRRDEALKYKKRKVSTGMKSLARMKRMEMMEAAQISIKVKLRRRTKGEVWEVVSVQGMDGFSPANRQSLLAALTKDGAELLRPQADLTQGQPPPSTAHPHHIHTPQTPTSDPSTCLPHLSTYPKLPPQHDATSDLESPSSDLCTPNLNTDSQSALLAQPQGPLEESDEQIEKLLEDIMMGLNILPSTGLERDCSRSPHLQPSYDGALDICEPSFLDGAARQSGMHTAVSAVGCHGYGTGSDDTSSIDTVLHSISTSQFASSRGTSEPYSDLSPQSKCPPCCVPSSSHSATLQFPPPNPNHPNCSNSNSVACGLAICCSGEQHSSKAQNQPRCTSTASLQPTVMLIQHHQCSARSHSLRCTQQEQGMTCQDISVAKYKPAMNRSKNNGDKVDRPHVKMLSRLTVKSGVLQFPLSSMVQETCPSILQGSGYNCQPMQCQEHLECSSDSALMHQHNRESCAGPGIKNEVGKRIKRKSCAGSRNLAEQTAKCENVKQSFKPKRKECDGRRDTQPTRKKARKCMNYTGDMLGHVLRCKEAKVSDGTQIQINLSSCLVSLSRNNVLAKERKKATNSLNIPTQYAEKPQKVSDIAERVKGAVNSLGTLGKLEVLNADQIRTRSSSRKFQQGTLSDGSREIPQTLAKRVGIVDKIEAPKRKPGRPRKIKLEDLISPDNALTSTVEYMRGRQELQEKEDKPQRKYSKDLRHIGTEVAEIPSNVAKDTQNSDLALEVVSAKIPQRTSHEEPCSRQHDGVCSPEKISAIKPNKDLKQTLGPDNADRAEADIDQQSPANKLIETKRTPMVSLKEFRELIKHRHLKTGKGDIYRKKIVSCKTENVESEGKTDSDYEALTEKTEVDIDITQTLLGGDITTSDADVCIPFDKKHNQIIRTENCRTQTDDNNPQKQMTIKKEPKKPDQNNNEVLTETKGGKEREDCSSTSVLTLMVKVLPSDEKSPTIAGKMEDSQLNGKDNRHIVDAVAKESGLVNIATLKDTVELEEVGMQEINRSLSGQMEVEVDFSIKEIAFNEEDHPVSCCAATGELSKREEDTFGAGEEEVVKMGVCRGGNEHLLNPDKELEPPKSNGQSASTAEGITHRHIYPPQVNKMATTHHLSRVTMGSSCDQEEEDEEEEEVEVDILHCSPEQGFWPRECGVGLNIVEIYPEEEEEVKEIDVTTVEAE